MDALVRTPGKAATLEQAGVRLVTGDLSDTATLVDMASGADGLFHIAGWFKVGVRDRSDGERVNVEGTRAVLGTQLGFDPLWIVAGVFVAAILWIIIARIDDRIRPANRAQRQ